MWCVSPQAFCEYQKLVSVEVATGQVVIRGITGGIIVDSILVEWWRCVMYVRRNATRWTCDHYCSYRTCSCVSKLIDEPCRFICLRSLQLVTVLTNVSYLKGPGIINIKRSKHYRFRFHLSLYICWPLCTLTNYIYFLTYISKSALQLL